MVVNIQKEITDIRKLSKYYVDDVLQSGTVDLPR